MKKICSVTALTGIIAGALLFAGTALAATPTLSLNSTGDGNTVQVNVTGDPSSSILMFYTETNVGSEIASLGTTDSIGNFSLDVSSSSYGIASGSAVYVRTGGVNGPQSATLTWPTLSTTGSFSLSPTSEVLAPGQNATITATNNGSNSLYLSNNSNPPVANVNISGNQVSVSAISNGSTVVTICTQTTASTNNLNPTTTCASAYITVQTSGGQTLTFSLDNVTVAPGQSVPITISGGSGNYSVLTNSNSSVIQTNISGSTVTLTANSTSGSAAITICSAGTSTCGIINAAASSTSTTALTFSPSNPTVSIGQTANVTVLGGSTTNYYVSSNSNTSAVSTSLSGNTLVLTGASNGSASIIVCSSGGSCGTLSVTVSYTSYGGALALSQTSLTLLAGQVLTVTVSGGTTPYTLSQNSGSIFQASLNGNVVTVSGVASGSSTLNVCSSGGACTSLSVTVNSSGAGTPITLSQNNLNLSAGNVTALTIAGSGGYYLSNSSSPSVASVQINGSTALITALSAGNDNTSICQSGGQCALLSIIVTTGTASTAVPTFSQNNPTIPAGQVLNETIVGGATSNYYILANTNPTVTQLSLNGNTLALTGLTSGASSVAVCAASNSCSVLNVTVSGSAPSNLTFATNSIPSGTAGVSYSTQISATGGSGSYTFALSSGSILPAGLSLSSSGLLSGTPTTAGTNSFSVAVTDSSGNSASANLSLVINAALAMPALTVPTSTPATSTGTLTTPGSYANGELINENGTIYIVYQNTKVGFANAAAFLGLGFKFSNVTAVTDSGLALSTKVVVTADGAHPRGAWLLSGQTVYFATPQGLIPVPSWSILLSNSGQASFIVPANSYDLARTILPLMTSSDSRLSP